MMLGSGGLQRGMAGIMTHEFGAGTIAIVALRNLRLTFFDFGLFRLGPFSSGLLTAR